MKKHNHLLTRFLIQLLVTILLRRGLRERVPITRTLTRAIRNENLGQGRDIAFLKCSLVLRIFEERSESVHYGGFVT